jgi:hypothetical protein
MSTFENGYILREGFQQQSHFSLMYTQLTYLQQIHRNLSTVI